MRRDKIELAVWGDRSSNPKRFTTQVWSLRTKLGDTGGRLIETISPGLRFNPDADSLPDDRRPERDPVPDQAPRRTPWAERDGAAPQVTVTDSPPPAKRLLPIRAPRVFGRRISDPFAEGNHHGPVFAGISERDRAGVEVSRNDSAASDTTVGPPMPGWPLEWEIHTRTICVSGCGRLASFVTGWRMWRMLNWTAYSLWGEC